VVADVVEGAKEDTMIRHPAHYTGAMRRIGVPVIVQGRYNSYELGADDVFIVCTCGKELFEVYLSGFPEVKCVCVACRAEYLVYDVAHYPAAAGYEPERGNFKKWLFLPGTNAFQVVPNWCYPADTVDDNDLDWFTLVAREPLSGIYIEVVNDETA
jgi:hypothetical protein